MNDTPVLIGFSDLASSNKENDIMEDVCSHNTKPKGSNSPKQNRANFSSVAPKSPVIQRHATENSSLRSSSYYPAESQFKKGDMVKLNVGGEVFHTTWDTLTKGSDSMLNRMFSGQIPLHQDEHKCVFIDRDGKYFQKVLNYLRNGSIEVPKSKAKCCDLLKEAEFYQLQGLSEVLKEALLEEQGTPLRLSRITKVGKQITVIKTESEKDTILKTSEDPVVILEVTPSSFS